MLLRASSAACYSTLGDHRRLANPSARETLFLNFRRRPSPLPALKQPMSSIPPRSSQTRASTGSADSVSSERKDDLPMHVLTNTKVGILGGGQLGKIMCQAASCMAIKVLTLDPLEKCPASGISYCHVVGDFNDGEAVREFAKRCDVVTIEIEHVDAVMLEKLEQQGIDCQPKAFTIKIIQDKYLQKVHFSQHGIPLPEFMQIDNIESAERAPTTHGRLAYDGRGNAVAHSKEELSSAVAALGGFDRALYVERWTPFVK
ncbi:hypothetical protein J5N97_023275 [Dioscorea zingiberensis]|uniref:Uncharacterized protein n=1 Tax=Dioscorea zingiberensis TaxID=325984 RepID=A0A9D5HBS6_9LILI|nr:hypothetical protein J5N97_023275 [Dioscorea zingiberensis]